MTTVYFLILIGLAFAGFVLSRSRAVAVVKTDGRIHSLPTYHGLFTVVCVLLPMLLLLAVAAPIASRVVEQQSLTTLDPNILTDELRRGSAFREIREVAEGRFSGEASSQLKAAADTYSSLSSLFRGGVLAIGAALGLAGIAFAWRRVSPTFRARNRFELIVKIVLLACASVAVLTTVGIVFSVLFETIRFFQRVPVTDFLFGLQWSPQTAIRADQVGSSGAFGIAPLVAGTVLITLIAILIAGPIGLFAAVYMAEYATPRFRSVAKPVLEILAGIPTVVLGFFAALTVAPIIREAGAAVGLSVASESALAAGIVMGMMIIPFVSSLSDDVINAVPQSLRDASYAMGATKSETAKKVVLPAALPGIVSAMMLAISRAVGETMIVVMAAGLAANLTFNPLEAVTTFTVQIKTILVGDQEFDSAKTLAAFALGFVLFFFTLFLNVIALSVVRRYREQYD